MLGSQYPIIECKSDPHGGNFILLSDGRIGLIDYGSTKHFTRNERLSACLLYAALKRKDEAKLFQMCEIGGYKSKYGKKDVLYKLIQFGYNDWSNDLTGGRPPRRAARDAPRRGRGNPRLTPSTGSLCARIAGS